MKATASIVIAVLLLATQASASEHRDPRLPAARAAAQELGKELKVALMQSMGRAGPVAAIATCQLKAPEISARLSNKADIRVGRTALRVRNPANAPDQHARAVLQALDYALLRNPEAPPPEHFQVFADGSARYMRAIPTQAPCLTCHGAVLETELKQQIRQRYPQDQATGFALGELRGAFIIDWPAGHR